MVVRRTLHKMPKEISGRVLSGWSCPLFTQASTPPFYIHIILFAQTV